MSGPSQGKKTKPKHHHGQSPYKPRDQRRGGENGGSSSHGAQPDTYQVSCSSCYKAGIFLSPVASWTCESCRRKEASDVPQRGNHQPSEYACHFPPLADADSLGSYPWGDEPVYGNQQQLVPQSEATWATAGLAAAPHGADLTFSAGGGDSEMMAFQQTAEFINADSIQPGRSQETYTATASAVDGTHMPIHTVQPGDASLFFSGVSDGFRFDTETENTEFGDQADEGQLTPEYR